MILVLRPGSTEADVAEVLQELDRRGCAGRVLVTEGSSVVHVVSGRTRRVRKLRALDQVLEVVPTSGPRVRREGWRFYPYHFVNWSACGIALLGLLVFLAGLLPTGIGAAVDYSHPAESVSQPWYLWAPLAFTRLFPSSLFWLAWTLLGLASLAVLLLPLLDRSRPDSGRARALRFVSALALVAVLALTLWQGAGS